MEPKTKPQRVSSRCGFFVSLRRSVPANFTTPALRPERNANPSKGGEALTGEQQVQLWGYLVVLIGTIGIVLGMIVLAVGRWVVRHIDAQNPAINETRANMRRAMNGSSVHHDAPPEGADGPTGPQEARNDVEG